MQPTRYMAIFFGPTRLRLTAIAFSTAVLAGCAAQPKEKITWNTPRVTPPAEAATTAPSDLPSDGKLRDKALLEGLFRIQEKIEKERILDKNRVGQKPAVLAE